MCARRRAIHGAESLVSHFPGPKSHTRSKKWMCQNCSVRIGGPKHLVALSWSLLRTMGQWDVATGQQIGPAMKHDGPRGSKT
jgi:hypothetical protein